MQTHTYKNAPRGHEQIVAVFVCETCGHDTHVPTQFLPAKLEPFYCRECGHLVGVYAAAEVSLNTAVAVQQRRRAERDARPMKGRKARAIRRSIYGTEFSPRERRYSMVSPLAPHAPRDCICYADERRQAYQHAKRAARVGA